MSALSLNPSWPSEVYELQTDDPVQGGTPDYSSGGGKANWQAQQLGDRTEWLRAYVLEQQVQQLSTAACVHLRQFLLQEAQAQTAA